MENENSSSGSINDRITPVAQPSILCYTSCYTPDESNVVSMSPKSSLPNHKQGGKPPHSGRKLLVLALGLSIAIVILGCILIIDKVRQPSESTVAIAKSSSAPDSFFGICYSPFHHPEYGSIHTISKVLTEDLNEVRKHYTLIRTYYSNFLGVNVAAAVQGAGMKVALGVTMTVRQSPYAYRELEIQSAIHGAIHHSNAIVSIYAGNENLQNLGHTWGSVSAGEIIGVIERIRHGLIGTAGQHIPIGTVQRINEWLEQSEHVEALANACDVIGVNIYPFFTPVPDTMTQIQMLQAQWDLIFTRFPQHAHKIRLTETGFPTQGTAWFSNNVPNLENAEKYFRDFNQWQKYNDRPSYYFKYHDERHPTPTRLDVDRYFGIADEFSVPKFSLLREPTPPPVTEAPATEKPRKEISSSPPPTTKTPTIDIELLDPEKNVTKTTTELQLSNVTAWFCLDPQNSNSALSREMCTMERNCDSYASTALNPISDQFYCCHSYKNSSSLEECPKHLALSWSACNVSELSSFCHNSVVESSTDNEAGGGNGNTNLPTTDTTNNMNNNKGAWVCQEHTLGAFNRGNCEFADVSNIQISSASVQCCANNGDTLYDDPQAICPPSRFTSWSQCSFSELHALIQASKLRNILAKEKAEADRYDDDLGNTWYCQHGFSSSFRQEHCTSVHCIQENTMAYRCCDSMLAGSECSEQEQLPPSQCHRTTPMDLCRAANLRDQYSDSNAFSYTKPRVKDSILLVLLLSINPFLWWMHI